MPFSHTLIINQIIYHLSFCVFCISNLNLLGKGLQIVLCQFLEDIQKYFRHNLKQQNRLLLNRKS